MDIPTSLSLARIRGTSVNIHLITVLTLGAYGLLHAAGDTGAVLRLGCVVAALCIHEFGHHVAARFLGIGSEKTVVFPFGTLSIISRKPAPTEEIAYRLAGPLANLLVVLFVSALHDVVVGVTGELGAVVHEFSFWNALLGAINLLPIAPFDGGAVLDAENRRRGRIAPWSLRGLSVCSAVGLLALGWSLADPVPVAAALGAVICAAHRTARERTGALVSDLTITSVMTPLGEIPTIPHGVTVTSSIERVLRSTDTVFLVSHLDSPLGFAFRNDIVDAAIAGEQRYMAELIDHGLTRVDEGTPLVDVLGRIGVETTDPLIVSDGEQLRGLVFREQILEFMLVRNATQIDNSSPSADRSC